MAMGRAHAFAARDASADVWKADAAAKTVDAPRREAMRSFMMGAERGVEDRRTQRRSLDVDGCDGDDVNESCQCVPCLDGAPMLIF